MREPRLSGAWGLGFRASGLQGLELGFKGLGCGFFRVWGLGFRALALGSGL